MDAFIFYSHDDRYSTPNMEIVTAADLEAARALARLRLEASPHHLAIEIWRDDKLLSRVERSDT